MEDPLLADSCVARRTAAKSHTSVLISQRSLVLSYHDDSASVSTCTLNLVLSTVGVGALTLPWSTATVGWLQSSLLMVVFFLVSVYNLYLLDRSCRAVGSKASENGSAGSLVTSYAEVVALALGRLGAYGLESFMLLYSFGLAVSYLGVIGTELSALAERGRELGWDALEPGLCQPMALMTMASVCLVLPLSLLPDEVLRHSGALGTLCMVFVTCVVVCMAPWRMQAPFVDVCAGATNPDQNPVAWVPSVPALLTAVPMFTFAMNAATAFVAVRSQMALTGKAPNRQPSGGDVEKVIWGSMIIALLDYAVCSAAGYATFCAGTPDNVLNGYSAAHALTLAARLALAVQLTMAVAGVYVPLARASMWHLAMGMDAGAPQGVGRSVTTVVFMALLVVVARALDGALQLPLGLTSAVCTTAIMFIFPGLCASRLAPPDSSLLQRAAPLAFAGAGLLIGAGSTVTLLMGAA